MASNLQVDQGITTEGSVVKDQGGNESVLNLSSDRIGISQKNPLYRLHVVANGGFGRDDANGMASPGNVPIVAQSNSTAIGILNGAGRTAFAININEPRATNSQRGVPTLYDKFDGSWHPSIALRNGRVGVGTDNPQARLDVDGDVRVSGDVVFTGADCAEDFNITDGQVLEPGTVMVIGNEDMLSESVTDYDRRVAGVLSGAGDYRPGIILDKRASSSGRLPLALTGKVFCKVDARYGSIQIGDLLTTSLTPGHAMKAADPLKAFGAVIGKALRPLTEGQGLIPILVALQ